MAKRRKESSLAADVVQHSIEGNWKVAAFYATALWLLAYVITPSIHNLYLKVLLMALRPFMLLIFWILVVICVAKLLTSLGRSKNDHYSSDWNPPAQTSDDSWSKPSSFDLHTFYQSPPKRNHEWSLKLIREIEWKKFEELSTAYYREKGIKANATPLGADGGIDIKLYQGDSTNPTSIVQCKAWNSRFVGVKEIREFLGVMTHEKMAKGFYMTSGDFSEDAKALAKSNSITLINGEMLLMMIKRLPDESQKRLLDLSTEGDYTTPSCPTCGVKMIKRNGKRGQFWGCRNFPRCRHMLHAKAAEKA